MNNYIFKIKSGYYSNITYELYEYVDIDMSLLNHSDLVYKQSIYGYKLDESIILDIFKYKHIYSRFIGKSRVDGYPMFQIDLQSITRHNKILEILDV